MTTELQNNLNAILLDKNTNLLPQNLKDGVTVLGVEGSLKVTGSDSNIKLFETVEDMNSDPNPKEGDLAVVYREEIQTFKEDTETQFITFPETVTLPAAITSSYSCSYRYIDKPYISFSVRLNDNSFSFSSRGAPRINITYTSVDGVTYNRDTFSIDNLELTNPVDLEKAICIYNENQWNNNFGYFMQISTMNFKGLYKWGNYLLKGAYCNSYATNTELNNIPYLSPNISRPSEVGYDYNIIMVTASHLDISGLYKIIDKCKVLWYGGGYGRDAVYNGKQGILITLYEPSYAESSSSNLNLVLEEYDFTISTDPTSKQIIRNWDDISIFPSPIYVAQARSSSSDPYNRKWYFTSYENADYTGNGHPSTYKHTIYTVPNDITLPISSTGYSTPQEITSKDSVNYYVEIYTNRYELAPNQFTLNSSDQLLPNISAYGNNGAVIGDGSIVTPDNTFLDTASQVYYEIQKHYDEMEPRVLTDNDKDIDINTKFIPTKTDGTSLLDTSNLTDAASLFENCKLLTRIPLLNTSKVTNMNSTFDDCSSLTEIPLIDTSKVTYMAYVFSGCSSLTSIPQLNTSNVVDMHYMFNGCSSLTQIPLLDTSKNKEMDMMFYGCENLVDIPVLNTSMVNSMYQAFNGCVLLSNDTLNNILTMILNATQYDSTKTLAYIGLTEDQATTCTTFSNWSACQSAGWTTGY